MEPVSPVLPLWLGGGLGHVYTPLPGGSLGSGPFLAQWIISARAGGKSPCIWSPLCAAAFFELLAVSLAFSMLPFMLRCAW